MFGCLRKFHPFALVLALFASHALAQPAPSPSTAPELRYVGSTMRGAIGYDSDNKLRGEWLQIFGEDARSAWIGELWATSRSAGGAQLSYHWQPDGAADAPVRKLFAAIDQNRDHDRKVTAGGGVEYERWFLNGYVSAGVTGRRETDFQSTTTTQTITGVENGRPFEQDIFTTVETRRFERAYDYGVGIRAGHFYTGPLVRVEAGGDYEWGRGNASQTTVSLSVEKFFAGTPHSIAISAEAYHKRGDFETSRNDQRIVAMYRYSFGGPQFRSERQYRDVRVETPPPPAAVAPAPAPRAAPAPAQAPRIERRLVKTTATAAADAFFDLDRASIRSDARSALDDAIAKLKASGFEGNIHVVGHTCNLGTAAYNQKLSERRAAAVHDYLVAHGLPADRIVAEGRGLREPRYPNDEQGRPKNRRVDIEFVTYEDRMQEVAVPAEPPAPPAPPVAAAPREPTIEWRREEIASEPTWVRRALRDPVRHKQTVDVYKTQTQTTTTQEGSRRFLDRAPVAIPDAFTVQANSTSNLFDLLANDSDPDNDALVIASVTVPAHGTATIAGTRIAYTPAAGYIGADTFSYTIRDPAGLTATATVSVTVVTANHPPVAQDDSATAPFDFPVAIDVLANDSDPDGDPLTIVSFTQPDSGKATVTRGPGNKLTYTPINFVGFDHFTYTISDGRGGTATATVTVFADP